MYRIRSFERLISELAPLRFAPRCALTPFHSVRVI